MANSLISMIKGDSTLIDNTEVLDGQLLLDETNKKIYLDDNNERIDFSQGGGETSSDANLAYVEKGTVATRGYAAGAYVIVEGQLYKTLTQINSGTTFITEGVNANVEATNIGSEVTQLNNDLTELERRGFMPNLNFTTPLHHFTAGNLTYTATKECYFAGSFNSSNGTITINGTNYVNTSGMIYISPLKLSVGDTVVLSTTATNLYVFEEIS